MISPKIRQRIWRVGHLRPDELFSQSPGQRVIITSTAGYANQVRSAMAAHIAGLTPVALTNQPFRDQAASEEGIILADLFPAMAQEEAGDNFKKSYRNWIVEPPRDLDAALQAEAFNALNWLGLTNAHRLPYLSDLRARMRAAFLALGPVLDLEATRPDHSDQVAVHLRMFGRNYTTRYVPPSDKNLYARHYAREAWSSARRMGAVAAIARIAERGETVSLYTDRRDHEDVIEICSRLSDAGIAVHFSDLAHGGALGAMEESMKLSGHRRLVLTASSSFGHLSALLCTDLDLAISV